MPMHAHAHVYVYVHVDADPCSNSRVTLGECVHHYACVYLHTNKHSVLWCCAMPCHVMPCLVTLCREVMHVCTHVPTVGMHIRMLYVSTHASLCSSVVCIFFLPLFCLQDRAKQNTSKHQIWQRQWPARDKLPRSKITSTYPYTSKSNIPRQQYRAGTNHASGTGGMTTHTPLTDEPPITQAEAGTKPKTALQVLPMFTDSSESQPKSST